MSTAEPPHCRDGERLAARSRLHEAHARRDWFGFLADAARLGRGERALDGGCGPCAFWRQQRLPRVELTLLDIAPAMLERGLEVARRRQDRALGVRGDLAALPFASGAFDAVLAFHALYHVETPAAAVRELARVLRPGGRAAIALNRVGNLRAITEIRDAVLGLREGDPGAAVFSADDCLSLARREFAQADPLAFEEVMSVSEARDVADYALSLPGCSERGREIEAATRAAIDRSAGTLRVAKSQAVVVCLKEAA